MAKDNVIKMKSKKKAVTEEKATKAKSTKPTSPGKTNPGNRFVGKTSNLSVTDYQNKMLQSNFKAKLTDEQLAKAFRAEFPNAKAYTAEDLPGIRSAFNRGKHGNDAPAKPLPAYDDAGEAMSIRGEKSAAKAAKKETKAAKTAVKTVSKKAAKAEDEDEEEVEDDEEEVVEDEDEEEEAEAKPAPSKRRRIVNG